MATTSLIETLGKIPMVNRFKVDPNKVEIEDIVFRVFSRTTVLSFVICATLVTLQTLVGEHIKCILPPKEDIRPEPLNQYCFIMSTYTVPQLYNRTVGVEIPHFGVGPHVPEQDEQKYHYYYQWVPFILFFQGLSFLIPHYLWKAYENNRIKAYCNLEVAPSIKMQARSLIDSDLHKEQKEKVINRAADYFCSYIGFNNIYAIFYIFCELLNIAIVVLNFYLTDHFLGGGVFKTYGPDVVAFLRDNVDMESDLNPMNLVFPKVAKCDFHKYGPSGNLIRYDVLCVLALNIINEKIYVYLWFLFIILCAIGGLQALYRIILMVVPEIRRHMLQRRVPNTSNHRNAVDTILQGCNYSDWFVLKLISDNIDCIRFGELCLGIREILSNNSPNGRLSAASSASYNSLKDGKDDSKPFINNSTTENIYN